MILYLHAGIILKMKLIQLIKMLKKSATEVALS